MRKISIILLLGFAGSVWNIRAQYNMEELQDIRGIDISGNIQLEIRFQDKHALDIKSQDLNEECFVHGIENGVLKLKIKTSLNCDGEVRAILTIPRLDKIKLAGKAEIFGFGVLKADTLTIYQQLGSKAYLDVNVDILEVKLMEGSVLELKGTASSQNAGIQSKATYNALELETDITDITANLLANAKICVKKQLTASAGANAYILYTCDPEQTEFKTTLGGKIEKSQD